MQRSFADKRSFRECSRIKPCCRLNHKFHITLTSFYLDRQSSLRYEWAELERVDHELPSGCRRPLCHSSPSLLSSLNISVRRAQDLWDWFWEIKSTYSILFPTSSSMPMLLKFKHKISEHILLIIIFSFFRNFARHQAICQFSELFSLLFGGTL